MRFYADLHIHSKYSRACSKDCDLENLTWWAKRKGIGLVGTGDVTHPAWFAHLQENLVDAEPGLFRLRPELERDVDRRLPPSCVSDVRFMLSVEISTIYKRDERTRKVHHLIYLPDFAAAAEFNRRLGAIGNIGSDGRPILGLDSRDLLEIALECSPDAYLVPAHIWTPWFSVLGSKAGFDAVEDCYLDLAEHIFALETGLSADPEMIWRVSSLDGYRLVSYSDAHSPPMLGRETSRFDTDLDYYAVRTALATGEGFLGSVEFFPQEGKYHLDGHRKCEVRLDPAQTRELGGRCPVCAKPVTVGVLHRVHELADREPGERPPGAAPFQNLIPLPEIVGEILGVGPKSKKVQSEIAELTAAHGPELSILGDVPLDDVAQSMPQVAEALGRLRRGEVIREAGYDGEYGTIRLFQPAELSDVRAWQAPALFDHDLAGAQPERAPRRGAGQRMDDTPTAGATPRVSGAAGKAGAVAQSTDAGTDASSCGSVDDADDALPGRATEPASPAPVVHVVPAGGDEPDSAPDQPALPVLAEPSTAGPGEVSPTLLDGLDPDQRVAAGATSGPLLIVAGPGTGKTRTLTHRIAYMVAERGVAPRHCLAITFTRKAAGELVERLNSLIGRHARQLTVGTFHSFGLGVLRENHARFGLTGDFGVADSARQLEVLAEVLGDQSKARTFTARLSRYRRGRHTDEPEVARVCAAYLARLRQLDLVDFDDLAVLPTELFESDTALAAEYQNRYQWVYVDEYQDVDAVQYRLLRALVPEGGNITAIGDPDQAIYRFRGADVGFFMAFREDYPTASVVHLTRNYRCGAHVLAAASQVVQPSTLVPDRVLRVAERPDEPARVRLFHAATEQSEAAFLTRTIEQLLGGSSFHSRDSGRVTGEGNGSVGFSDIAVLYRTSAQARPVVEALTRAGYPFQQHSHDRLADRPAVREILDEFGFASPASKAPDVLSGLHRAAEIVLNRIPAYERDERAADVHTAVDLLTPLATDCGGNMERFRHELLLGAEVDALDPRADRISLLTMHAAKGLEFPVVFVIGCEDGLVPMRWPGEEGDAGLAEAELAEERRLLFVAMTRAQNLLYVSHAGSRTARGEQRATRPSPFLGVLDDAVIERLDGDDVARKPRARQLTLM